MVILLKSLRFFVIVIIVFLQVDFIIKIIIRVLIFINQIKINYYLFITRARGPQPAHAEPTLHVGLAAVIRHRAMEATAPTEVAKTPSKDPFKVSGRVLSGLRGGRVRRYSFLRMRPLTTK